MCPGRNDLGLAMMWSQGPLQCGDGRVFLSSPPLGTTLYCIPYGTFSCNSMGTMAMGDGMMALGYQIQSYPPHGSLRMCHIPVLALIIFFFLLISGMEQNAH